MEAIIAILICTLYFIIGFFISGCLSNMPEFETMGPIVWIFWPFLIFIGIILGILGGAYWLGTKVRTWCNNDNVKSNNPQKYGEWKYDENGTPYCSVCHLSPRESGTKYCPYCGTRMKRKDD